MKKFVHFTLYFLTTLLATSAAQAQDMAINILGTSATLPLSTTGSIQVDICNTDPSNVSAAINTVNPQISVGWHVKIVGITAMDGSPLTTFSVVTSNSQLISLTNSVPVPNSGCLSFKVIVQGKVIDTPGDVSPISAILTFQGSPTAGNKVFNDQSTTSIAVVVNPQLKPDLTPIIYSRPSLVYGDQSVSLIVDVLELNSIATSKPITVKITRDPMFSLQFNPTLNLMEGRPVQNSAWSFDNSDVDYYILTTSQLVSPGGSISFGLSGSFSANVTTGVVNISSTIVDNGSEQNLTNNTSANKIEYFHQ